MFACIETGLQVWHCLQSVSYLRIPTLRYSLPVLELSGFRQTDLLPSDACASCPPQVIGILFIIGWVCTTTGILFAILKVG
jgi:hypothetical protein